MQEEFRACKGLRILIVEDEPDIRNLFARGLSMQGAEVVQAADGQEGWEIFQQNPDGIDAVISDILMPRMNGIELLNCIKEVKPGTPILLVTGYAHDHDKQIKSQCILPPDILLEKPFHLSLLIRTLLDILENRLAATG